MQNGNTKKPENPLQAALAKAIMLANKENEYEPLTREMVVQFAHATHTHLYEFLAQMFTPSTLTDDPAMWALWNRITGESRGEWAQEKLREENVTDFTRRVGGVQS